MNNDLEVAYPQSGSFCSGPGRIGIWKCWFVTGLIRGRLKRATSFFIAFCNNRPLHRCTVAPLFLARSTVSLGRDLEV